LNDNASIDKLGRETQRVQFFPCATVADVGTERMTSIVKTRIVVLGGGFGGCFATRRLERLVDDILSIDGWHRFPRLGPQVGLG